MLVWEIKHSVNVYITTFLNTRRLYFSENIQSYSAQEVPVYTLSSQTTHLFCILSRQRGKKYKDNPTNGPVLALLIGLEHVIQFPYEVTPLEFMTKTMVFRSFSILPRVELKMTVKANWGNKGSMLSKLYSCSDAWVF